MLPRSLAVLLSLFVLSMSLIAIAESPRKKIQSHDNGELIVRIHVAIMAKTETIDRENFSRPDNNYTETIPSTGATFEMIAIPGGSFAMGAAADDDLAQDNEGAPTTVTVSPFWMGKCEVTWDQYEPFMITRVDREKHGGRIQYDPATDSIVDGVSQPTPPYTEMSFGMGQSGYPAISMTQHAANKYCQWLSAQTGHFYRLPTEAEWEYACRAGTTTPYSFGQESDIDPNAWFYDNAADAYGLVGTKRANPWGLHDMHGNVAEWVADGYADDYHVRIGDNATDPYLKPTSLYPRTVRGGHWDDDPEMLRSSVRRASDPTWKDQDPQLPRSIWYHTDAQWLGFRVVRPLDVPDAETMDLFWNSATGYSD